MTENLTATFRLEAALFRRLARFRAQRLVVGLFITTPNATGVRDGAPQPLYETSASFDPPYTGNEWLRPCCSFYSPRHVNLGVASFTPCASST